jgi:hypothetical protein
MHRTLLSALALTAGLLPTAAASQHTFGQWTVDYNAESEVCWMSQAFDSGGGVSSEIDVFLPAGSAPSMTLRNSSWTMAEGDLSAEIWLSADWERAADETAPGTYHQADGATHIDLTLSELLFQKLASADAIVVRVAGGPFERYPIGPTRDAVDDLNECDYYMSD